MIAWCMVLISIVNKIPEKILGHSWQKRKTTQQSNSLFTSPNHQTEWGMRSCLHPPYIPVFIFQMLELIAWATFCQILSSNSGYLQPLITRQALFVGTDTKYHIVIDICSGLVISRLHRPGNWEFRQRMELNIEPNFRRYTSVNKIELDKMLWACLKELLYYRFKINILRENVWLKLVL